MNKFLDSALIALDAIWAAKLRSLMTVLGNIVAVTSIIAVVSLIQGLNASVKQAILNQAGRRLVQHPAVSGHAQRRGVRAGARQPAHHAARRPGDPALRSPTDRRGHGRRERQRHGSPTATSRSTARRFSGVTAEYVNFSSFDAERGRLMSPTEVDTARPVAVIGWQTADRLFGAESTRSTRSIQIEGVHFRVVGVSAKRGSVLGQSQDEFAVIPLGQFQMMFGSRRSLSLTVKPRDRRADLRGDRRGDGGAAQRARGSSRSSRTTSASSPRTRSSTSTTRRPTASSRCWSASSRCRWSSAAS